MQNVTFYQEEIKRDCACNSKWPNAKKEFSITKHLHQAMENRNKCRMDCLPSRKEKLSKKKRFKCGSRGLHFKIDWMESDGKNCILTIPNIFKYLEVAI